MGPDLLVGRMSCKNHSPAPGRRHRLFLPSPVLYSNGYNVGGTLHDRVAAVSPSTPAWSGGSLSWTGVPCTGPLPRRAARRLGWKHRSATSIFTPSAKIWQAPLTLQSTRRISDMTSRSLVSEPRPGTVRICPGRTSLMSCRTAQHADSHTCGEIGRPSTTLCHA